MINKEFVPQKQQLIEFYKIRMEKLLARISEMKRNDDWFLLHYNTPVYNVAFTFYHLKTVTVLYRPSLLSQFHPG